MRHNKSQQDKYTQTAKSADLFSIGFFLPVISSVTNPPGVGGTLCPRKLKEGKGQERGLQNQLRLLIRFGCPCLRGINGHASCPNILFDPPYRGYYLWALKIIITWCRTLILPACDALTLRPSFLQS